MSFKKDVELFLRESNAIEGELSESALEDALSAWDYIHRKFNSGYGKVNVEDILHIHQLLMIHLRPDIAGFWRTVNVRVGGYIAPSAEKVPELMAEWWDEHRDAYTAEEIKQAHVAFENVHPFEDGNGRVGRILMLWQWCIAGLPVVIIKSENREAYYNWFKESREG